MKLKTIQEDISNRSFFDCVSLILKHFVPSGLLNLVKNALIQGWILMESIHFKTCTLAKACPCNEAQRSSRLKIFCPALFVSVQNSLTLASRLREVPLKKTTITSTPPPPSSTLLCYISLFSDLVGQPHIFLYMTITLIVNFVKLMQQNHL